jgi:hypothetical protein
MPPSPSHVWERRAPCRTTGRRGSGSCRIRSPSSVTPRSSPPQSCPRNVTAAEADGEARAGRHAPPWCVDMSDTSVRNRRCRHLDRPRRQGGERMSPFWRVRNAHPAGRRGTPSRAFPAYAVRCRLECRVGPPRLVRDDTGACNIPRTPPPAACGPGRRWVHRADGRRSAAERRCGAADDWSEE